MATSSIYTNVVIKNKTLARGLVSALENAKNKKSDEVTYRRGIEDMKKEDIKKIFGDN
ncbi:MAG: hypothetical protein LBU77_05275 [Clostridiales bacterium]|jgi:hypothetical protein|nr:hypothetical protein [Clostridiales bacterium]